MTTAFLLRFQEECLPDDSHAGRCGTKTLTSIHHEQEDNDLQSTGLSALPRVSMGTSTNAQVPQEISAVDPADATPHALPVKAAVLGTRTPPRVRLPTGDNKHVTGDDENAGHASARGMLWAN
jgi:hypothetical protein